MYMSNNRLSDEDTYMHIFTLCVVNKQRRKLITSIPWSTNKQLQLYKGATKVKILEGTGHQLLT